MISLLVGKPGSLRQALGRALAFPVLVVGSLAFMLGVGQLLGGATF